MKIHLQGERILVIPDNSDELQTASGIIIPNSVVSVHNNNLKSGIIAQKGAGTPWNKMPNIHVKQRVYYKRGSGVPYEEEEDGIIAKYLILSYQELLFV